MIRERLGDSLQVHMGEGKRGGRGGRGGEDGGEGREERGKGRLG